MPPIGPYGQVGGVPLVLLGPLIAAAVASATIVYATGAPAAWAFLAGCALATLPVVVWGIVTGRFLEPLPVLATACSLMFVVRPLQLFLSWPDLYSYFFPRDPGRRLVLLDGQEVAAFVTDRLQGPFEPAVTRAIGACTLFLVVLLLGYRLEAGERAAQTISRLRGQAAPPNLPAAVAIPLFIGIAAQVAIIARAGGPGESLKNAADQAALSDSFVLFLLSGFAFAGLIVWAAWRRPRTRLEWMAFFGSLLAICAFAVAAGSRSQVFLVLFAVAVVKHFIWNPWRRRELLAGVVVGLAFVSGFLALREYADEGSLGRAASKAPHYMLDERVVLNDITSFDHVLYVTSIYGQTRAHEHGSFLAGGVRAYVPRAIDPGKPEGGDIVLRRVVWRERFGAGRPPTAVGDLFIDFGYVGVALGALFIGILARALLGLVRGPPAGRQYRVALYAILLIVLYELVADTFSIAVGIVLTLLLPFVVAVHGFGRLPLSRPGAAGESAR